MIKTGRKDRIRRAKARLPFLLARNIVSKLPIFSRFVVRSNLRFSSCRQKQNKTLRVFFCFWRKGQDSNLRMFPSLVFKTSAFNHSATFPPIIITYYSAFVYTLTTSSRSSMAPSNFSNFSALSPSTGT